MKLKNRMEDVMAHSKEFNPNLSEDDLELIADAEAFLEGNQDVWPVNLHPWEPSYIGTGVESANPRGWGYDNQRTVILTESGSLDNHARYILYLAGGRIGKPVPHHYGPGFMPSFVDLIPVVAQETSDPVSS